MKVRSTPADKAVSVVTYVIVIALCLVILLPCLNVLALSFNDGKDAARGGVYFFPRMFTLMNYKEVFQDGSIISAYRITLARTFIGTFLSLAVTSFAAFALNQKELPGRGIIIFAITFTMLFGGGTIPTYVQYSRLGLIDNFWVYVIPSLVSVTYLIMMRSFFDGIPYELQEAAKLDGCGYFGTFFRVMLPLSKPVLAVVGLYTAVNHWNDWFAGAFYMTSSKLWPVQTVLQQMLSRAMSASTQQTENVAAAIAASQSSVTTDSLKMAAVVITTAPILCVYPFVQKYFAKGTLIGAVKG
ncbi:MAG: carbohydrate ABC transporter permease [Clostridia bacterium]|nr:carbohydrate ABC transporter permease [Clostridia bacterium]